MQGSGKSRAVREFAPGVVPWDFKTRPSCQPGQARSCFSPSPWVSTPKPAATPGCDEWAADDRLPSRTLDSSSSTRRRIRGIVLRPGDEIFVEGRPDGGEPAALDYVEIEPESR